MLFRSADVIRRVRERAMQRLMHLVRLRSDRYRAPEIRVREAVERPQQHG